MNKNYHLTGTLEKINQATSKFDQYMTDWNGDWLYDDRGTIEKVLGIKLEQYDALIKLKESIETLIKHGFQEYDCFSANELAAILELK